MRDGYFNALENREKAIQIAGEVVLPSILLGEENGKVIEGFGYPDPTSIVEAMSPQAAIILFNEWDESH